MSEKDYYEILGVRPSAGRDEIELAYKGRRSQYHPDRYGQSDAETQAWATSKMQDVNEAYAALTDETERSRFDRTRNSRTANPASQPQTPKHSDAADLKRVLQGCKPSGEPFEKIFVAPNIPLKKLSGAIESYGEGLRPKEIVALIDDTVFGGAKEGFLITETEIRFKALFQPTQSWRIEFIEEIASEGNCVFINGHEFGKLNIPEKKDVRAFFASFNTYLKQRKTDPAAHSSNTQHQDESAAPSAGERLFVGMRHGFYAQLEKSIQRDIEAADTKEEWITLALVSGLLPVSRALEQLARSHGVALSSAERAFLSSDMLRFELLTYGISVTGHLLSTEAGLDEEQISEIVMPVAVRMLLSYIVEIEGIGEQRTLRSIANPMAELKESDFFNEFRRRWLRYGLLLNGTAGNLVKEFDRSLKTPAAFNTHEGRPRVDLQFFSEQVIDRVLDTHSIPAFLESISEGVEAALVSMFEQA